jgi:hypothetical protein
LSATAARSRPAELDIIEKRAQVVELAKAGKSYRVIAKELGYASPQSVANRMAEWVAETKPTTEATEELRKLQAEQIDAVYQRLWPLLQTDDYAAVTDRLIKLMERKAKLMGLDLQAQPGINVSVTAEALAAVFGFDAPAIDAVAEEITDAAG